MGRQALLQGIFQTQESNPRLLRLLVLASRFFTTSATWQSCVCVCVCVCVYTLVYDIHIIYIYL